MKKKHFVIVMLAFSSVAPTDALAAEQAAPGLPGVKPQKPIVSAPPPAPEPDSRPAGSWKNFRVGNTDVSISGDITIDVSTGRRLSSGR